MNTLWLAGEKEAFARCVEWVSQEMDVGIHKVCLIFQRPQETARTFLFVLGHCRTSPNPFRCNASLLCKLQLRVRYLCFCAYCLEDLVAVFLGTDVDHNESCSNSLRLPWSQIHSRKRVIFFVEIEFLGRIRVVVLGQKICRMYVF